MKPMGMTREDYYDDDVNGCTTNGRPSGIYNIRGKGGDTRAYHSLRGGKKDSTDPDLLVTARTIAGQNSAGGVIMGVRHTSKPIYGVQFHPESVLTEGGYQMLGNWLESIGLAGAAAKSKTLSPLIS